MFKKIGAAILVAFALIFMAATIFNPNSRYYIDESFWGALWHSITGQ